MIMDEIEICNIQEENLCEDELRSAERPMKPVIKKRVRFAEPEVVQNRHSTAFKLCKFSLHIKQDIPEQFRTIVYHLYYVCILHNVINVCNFLFATFLEKTTVSIASTAIFCLVSLVFSYLVWLQCVYKTFVLKSKAHFITFLVTFSLQFVLSCIQTVGIHDTISIFSGFLSALESSPDIKSYTNFKMVAEVIISALCGCSAFVDFVLIVMILKIYSKIVRFCGIITPEEEIIKHV